MPQDLTGEGEGAGAGPVLPTQLALGVYAAAGPDSVFTGGGPTRPPHTHLCSQDSLSCFCQPPQADRKDLEFC